MCSSAAPSFRAGYHRLKTTSGCLTCRRRRKKCDEIKPTCTGCTRNQLTCVWPLWKIETSRKQGVEARAISKSTRKKVASINPKECLSERSWPCQPSLRGSPKSPLRESFDPVATISIDEDAQFSIISYCINYYLPIQVHHNPERDPVDQSYLISMSLCFPPLMNALLACSALTLRFGSKDWPSFAVQSYVLSLHEVRQGIADGRFTGTEDHLLATVMWLSIFEISRLDGRCSKSSTHLDAFSRLLRLRKPMHRIESSLAALYFERNCVEYFIYHSATLMLFDHTVDPCYDVENLQGTYHACLTSDDSSLVTQAAHSPYLGAPHQLFVLIIRATQLARALNTSSVENSPLPRIHYRQVVELQHALDQDICSKRDWPGRLYAFATRILLLKLIPCKNELQNRNQDAELSAVASDALKQLSIQLLGRVFGKYWLWPLAILGSIMTRRRDINFIRDKMDAISHRSHANAVKVVRYLLESIWASNLRTEGSDYSLEGLATLLDGDIMDRTSSILSLWAEDLA